MTKKLAVTLALAMVMILLVVLRMVVYAQEPPQVATQKKSVSWA